MDYGGETGSGEALMRYFTGIPEPLRYRWRDNFVKARKVYRTLDVDPEDSDNFICIDGGPAKDTGFEIVSTYDRRRNRVMREQRMRIKATAQHVNLYLHVKAERKRLHHLAYDLDWAFEPYRRRVVLDMVLLMFWKPDALGEGLNEALWDVRNGPAVGQIRARLAALGKMGVGGPRNQQADIRDVIAVMAEPWKLWGRG